MIAENSILEEIPLNKISANPNQPRERFDADAFSGLVASIGKHGIMQPIVVRPREDGFELVAGERRWRAAKKAGMTEIPAIVRKSSDSESLQLALVENIQREDLTPIEEAVAYKRLVDEFGCKQAELAELVGKNRATVANTMRLLGLPDSLREKLNDRHLTSGHARALLSLGNLGAQEKLAAKIIARGLSVRQTEELAKAWQLSKDKPSVKKRLLAPDIRMSAKKIGRSLGAKVRTRIVGDKVKVELEFDSVEGIKNMENIISARINGEADA